MRNRQIHAVRISIADPKQIEKWGKEVTRPETINYRTGLPEPDGLFCEKIFGPTKNFECYCGKFKNVRREGLVCDVCGVTVTHSRVRRRWMGTIRLAVPVVHPWFLNIQPGVIQTILALTKRALKQIVYYMKYAVTFVDVAKKERLLQRRPDAPEYTERLQELEEVSREDLLERLNHYVGPLRDWAESEIQLQLSRTSRPGYNRTVKPREYLFSIAGRQEVLSPVVDEVTGEVLMELRDQLDYRAITRLVESGLDLRKLMVKVGKTGRTLEKSISQRLTLEEIVADVESSDGHVVAAAGTSLRDVFWDLLVENLPVLLANVRDKEQFEDIQGRVVRDIAQIIDGLDAFHRLEGYVPLDGGSSTDGFIVSGAEKRNLDRISKIIIKRGDLAARDVFRVATGGNAIHELLRA
ncbi:hypothetical protein IIA16_05835, partial [bacterium]|nr:hypothetical protein [bacterium]